MKFPHYQSMNSHSKNKTAPRLSYLCNGNPTRERWPIYWNDPKSYNWQGWSSLITQNSIVVINKLIFYSHHELHFDRYIYLRHFLIQNNLMKKPVCVIVASALNPSSDGHLRVGFCHLSTWGPPGSCRHQMGPLFAPWTLLSGIACNG